MTFLVSEAHDVAYCVYVGVHTVGGVIHPLQPKMLGAPYLRPLTQVLVRQALLLPALHLVGVLLDRQLLVVKDLMNMRLVAGGQIHAHHLHLGHWQQISHKWCQHVLAVQRQGAVALSYLDLPNLWLKLQKHGGDQQWQ